MTFLFQEDSSSAFIKEFSERQPRMQKFLEDLEESAVQLDKMNFGAKVSSVAGSSVGAVGGVLTVVGLALIPVTAGVSLGLTMAGLGMGITSGVNSVITTFTEVGVNKTQQTKSNSIFQSFMEDVQVLQDCLEEVTLKESDQVDLALLAGTAVSKIPSVIKYIDSLCDAAAAFKAVKSEEVIRNAAGIAAQEGKAIGRVASDVPDISQAAIKGPLALSKSARAGLIAVNALFVGVDIFFICKDSIALAKGTETEFSQFIRARAALWHSEMDAWQKICDTLQEGQEKSQEYYAVLRRPFYTGSESSSEEADEENFELHEEESLHP